MSRLSVTHRTNEILQAQGEPFGEPMSGQISATEPLATVPPRHIGFTEYCHMVGIRQPSSAVVAEVGDGVFGYRDILRARERDTFPSRLKNTSWFWRVCVSLTLLLVGWTLVYHSFWPCVLAGFAITLLIKSLRSLPGSTGNSVPVIRDKNWSTYQPGAWRNDR